MKIVVKQLANGSYFWSGNPQGGTGGGGGPDGLVFQPPLQLENSGHVVITAQTSSGEATLKLSTEEEPDWGNIDGLTVDTDENTYDYFADSEGYLQGLLEWDESSAPLDMSLTFVPEGTALLRKTKTAMPATV